MITLVRSRFNGSSRGQAAVETALVLTIIMLFALGALDLGRGIAAHIALTEATQEGAMVAGYRYCDPGASFDLPQLQALITTSSSADAVAGATVPAPAVTAEYITVRSTYPMPVITPLASFIFGPNIMIGVEVDATNFYEAC
jgi:hypothetical protein